MNDNYFNASSLEHPHKRMHILLSVLAFVVVVGSITLYQIRSVKAPDELVVQESNNKPGELSSAQREKIIADLKQIEKTSPPLTDSQRAKIIADIKAKIK